MLAVTVTVERATVAVILSVWPHSLGQLVLSVVGMLARGMTVLVFVITITSSSPAFEDDCRLISAPDEVGNDGVVVVVM